MLDGVTGSFVIIPMGELVLVAAIADYLAVPTAGKALSGLADCAFRRLW